MKNSKKSEDVLETSPTEICKRIQNSNIKILKFHTVQTIDYELDVVFITEMFIIVTVDDMFFRFKYVTKSSIVYELDLYVAMIKTFAYLNDKGKRKLILKLLNYRLDKLMLDLNFDCFTNDRKIMLAYHECLNLEKIILELDEHAFDEQNITNSVRERVHARYKDKIFVESFKLPIV